MAELAASLNADCHSAVIERALLDETLHGVGDDFFRLVNAERPHLFANVAVFISAAQLQQMCAVINAVERVVALPGWLDAPGQKDCLGVFYGYDFHLNAQGAHLIEINSNAGGAFLNAQLAASQGAAKIGGSAVTQGNIEQDMLAMFQNEWRLLRGAAPLKTLAIVDEAPETQYLSPEFLLAQRLFARAGITALIVDPATLQLRDDGVYLGTQKIDLIYNRLTDFSLQKTQVLQQADLAGRVVLTPNPRHYARYADKRNLVRLSDAQTLRQLGARAEDILTLQAGVPHTLAVHPELEEELWKERKQWFFKPVSGFGSKGAYRGDKLTRGVFQQILQSDYVAQRIAQPGERVVCVGEAPAQALKFDVRCYVYDGTVQLIAARLYQGQTTNFRTPGGGFALVRVAD